MRFVSIPHLGQAKQNEAERSERPERPERPAGLLSISRLLRKQDVTAIMELQVDDDVNQPCGDDVVEETIAAFKISTLDWRKTDLCIDVLLNAAPRVERLRLYSSGNHAVLKSWIAPSGLPLLSKVILC
jgi:hypothetical protein